MYPKSPKNIVNYIIKAYNNFMNNNLIYNIQQKNQNDVLKFNKDALLIDISKTTNKIYMVKLKTLTIIKTINKKQSFVEMAITNIIKNETEYLLKNNGVNNDICNNNLFDFYMKLLNKNKQIYKYKGIEILQELIKIRLVLKDFTYLNERKNGNLKLKVIKNNWKVILPMKCSCKIKQFILSKMNINE